MPVAVEPVVIKNEVATMKSILLEHVDFSYQPHEPIFKGLDLQLGGNTGKGQITALMGASGSGKTTLLKLILGVLKPQKGGVCFTPGDAIFSYVPQEPVLFEHLTPMENAKYFSYASKLKSRFDSSQFHRLAQLLEISNLLEERANINELSGGQKQRLSVLRALSIQPEILLLDEPCTGLDADVKFAFLTKLHELVTELNLLAIYVTHHIDEAKFIGNNIAFLVQDGLTGMVEKVSSQQVEDFLKVPPSLDALRMIRFPEVNVAGIHREGNVARLSASPESFIAVESCNIEIARENTGIVFNRLFATGAYSCYRHEDSQTILTFDSSHSHLMEVIRVKLSGAFAKYGMNGAYQETLELEIMES